MTVALQRAQVVVIAKAVTGIRAVQDHHEYTRDPARGAELFVRAGKVNGTLVYSTPLQPERLSCAEQDQRVQFVLKTWLSVDEDSNSRKTAEELLQTLLDTFVAERTLNGTADNCTAPEGEITETPMKYQIGEGSYLCDLLTVRFVAEKRVAVTYS